jgi:phosphatidylglycerophosphate synthase
VITEAALYLATPADVRAGLALVAGRPLAFRMLMAAIRAGCRRVWVPAIFRGTAVERAVAVSPSARTAVRWLEAGAAPPSAPVLFLPAGALTAPAAVAALGGAPPVAVLAESIDSDAPVVAGSAALAQALWPPLGAGLPVADALGRALKDTALTVVDAAGWHVRVASPRDVAAAEARLYAALGSEVDSPLDRALHRRLSHPVSRLAARWGLAPNVVTLGSLMIGLGAVWCFWQATPGRALAGLALYAMAVVLDHADGEVARLALAESSFGAWLDVAVDTTIHALLMIALGLTGQAVAGGGAVAGVVAALGVVASAAVTQTSAPAGTGVGRFLDTLSNRDGFYAMLMAFIVGLAFLPQVLPALMILVAAGCHAFWLSHLLYRLTRRP